MQQPLVLKNNARLDYSLTNQQIKQFIIKNLGVAQSDLEYMNNQQIMQIYLQLSAGLQKALENEQKNKNLHTQVDQKAQKQIYSMKPQPYLPKENLNPVSYQNFSRQKAIQNNFRLPQIPIIIDESQSPLQNNFKTRNEQIFHQKSSAPSHTIYTNKKLVTKPLVKQKKIEIKQQYPILAIRQAQILDKKFAIQLGISNYVYVNKFTIKYIGDQLQKQTQLRAKLENFSDRKISQLKILLVEIFPQLTDKILSIQQPLTISQLFYLCSDASKQFQTAKKNYQISMTQIQRAKKCHVRVERDEYIEGIQRRSLQKARQIKRTNYRNIFMQPNIPKNKQQKSIQNNPLIQQIEQQHRHNQMPVVFYSKIYRQVVYSDCEDEQDQSPIQTRYDDDVNTHKQQLAWKRNTSTLNALVSVDPSLSNISEQKLSVSNFMENNMNNYVVFMAQKIQTIKQLKKLCQLFQEQYANCSNDQHNQQ